MSSLGLYTSPSLFLRDRMPQQLIFSWGISFDGQQKIFVGVTTVLNIGYFLYCHLPQLVMSQDASCIDWYKNSCMILVFSSFSNRITKITFHIGYRDRWLKNLVGGFWCKSVSQQVDIQFVKKEDYAEWFIENNFNDYSDGLHQIICDQFIH